MEHIDISMLLPSFNNVCVELVAELKRQADGLCGKLRRPLSYEIIVADDGSTDKSCIEANSAINGLEHCRFVRMGRNVGRAQIRNVLVGESRGDRLLLIDSDLTVDHDDYLYNFAATRADAVYGGTRIASAGDTDEGNGHGLHGNLRFRYEKKAEKHKTAAFRSDRPNQEISVCNFFARRDIMVSHPFDSRFKAYGYEDVLFGKRLAESGVVVSHIDNPMLIDKFEANAVFVAKTEEAILTLCRFESDLRGYSNLLSSVEKISRVFPLSLFQLWHRVMKRVERRNLVGDNPSLFVFKLYKLGFFLEHWKRQ